MIPHDFVLDYLYPLPTRTKKMFGNYAVYVENKIVLATRQNENKPIDNGIWVATSEEYHQSLKEEFSSLTNLTLYNIKKWLLLPIAADDFEEVAISLCELIKQNDPRIGIKK